MSNIKFENFGLNGFTYGDFTAKGSYTEEDQIFVSGQMRQGNASSFTFNSRFNFLQKTIDLRASLDQFAIDPFNPLLGGVLDELRGNLQGGIELYGPLDSYELNGAFMTYILHCNDVIDTDVLVDKINNSLPLKEQIKTSDSFSSSVNILVTTGAGNTIQGGADIWVNHFLNLVWPILPNKKTWRLLIDSKRPPQFDPKSLPKGLKYHFHFDDAELTDSWLRECKEIHSLHSHYHKRDHIWKYEDKLKTLEEV